MNLEPNKLPLGRVRKVGTTTSLLPTQIQPSYSSTYLTKEKLLETLKKQAYHQNNFEQGNQTNRSNNLNSKSKSSSRMPSREHSQVKLKNSENHNNNLREKNSSNIHQKVKELTDSKQKGFFTSSTSTSQVKRRESNENKNLNQMTKPVANSLMNSQKPPKKQEKINPSAKLVKKNKTIESCSEYYNYYPNQKEKSLPPPQNVMSLNFPPKKVFDDSVVISEENDTIFECEELILSDSKPKTIENPVTFSDDKKGLSYDAVTLNFLISQELLYQPDPFYFQKNQNNINPLMRTILLDWMMEVCSEFTLKRETFHLSVNYVDRYLSKVRNIEKYRLQLIGLSAMYIASKNEEICAPKIKDFMVSADNAFRAEDIKDMEVHMLLTLKFYLNPPTLNMWSNWYMNQWDLYVENPQILKNFNIFSKQFKIPNEESYTLFREFMQILDNLMLDAQTLQYKPRALIASLMYLVLGKSYKDFSVEQILQEFPFTSGYLISNKIKFNLVFSSFLSFCFGYEIFELLPTIQYVALFFGLNIIHNLPKAVKLNKENVLESHFEEFLAFQTHNKCNIDNIKKRRKI